MNESRAAKPHQEDPKDSDQPKSTNEPEFGIIIEAMGFRRFSLRGLSKLNLERKVVSLSYNLKCLFHLAAALQNA